MEKERKNFTEKSYEKLKNAIQEIVNEEDRKDVYVLSLCYACDDEEREVGLFCVGVPIFKNGKVVAAMSLAGPKFRIMDGEFQEKINFMKDLSAEITRELFVK